MESINVIKKYLKENLSPKRYEHSIGVMNRAEELAKIYGADENKAKLCGLAHDIAKEMSKEEYLQYVKEHSIKIDEIERTQTGLLHGKIGANIVKEKFKFPLDMQNAIQYHTTTDPNMDLLAKIIFVADKTELGRKSEYNIERERELADKDLDEAIIYIIKETLKSMLEKEKIIHPKMIETRNKIINKKTLEG